MIVFAFQMTRSVPSFLKSTFAMKATMRYDIHVKGAAIVTKWGWVGKGEVGIGGDKK